jgi:hypothetical protein
VELAWAVAAEITPAELVRDDQHDARFASEGARGRNRSRAAARRSAGGEMHEPAVHRPGHVATRSMRLRCNERDSATTEAKILAAEHGPPNSTRPREQLRSRAWDLHHRLLAVRIDVEVREA